MGTAQEVDQAHAAALAEKDKWEILEIQSIRQEDTTRSFQLRDFNGNWWEIYHRPGHLYDDVFDEVQAMAAA